MRKIGTTFALVAAACCSLLVLSKLRDGDRLPVASGGRAGRLFPESFADADMLSIERDGWRQELRRSQSGWRVVHPRDALADETAVQRLLDALEAAPRIETISARDQEKRRLDHEMFGLVEPRARVVVGSGAVRRELLVGSDSPITNQIFACFSDSPDVRVTSSSVFDALPRTSGDLRDRALVHFETKRVEGIDLRRPGKGFIRLQRRNGSWFVAQPVAAAADDSFVAELLSAVASARVADFLWSDDQPSLDSPGQSFKSRLAEGGLEDDGDSGAGPLRAVFRMSGGGEESICFGLPAPSLPGHVQVLAPDGRTIVAITNSLQELALSPLGRMRDYNLFPQSVGEVSALVLKREGQSLSLRRDAAGDWEMTAPVHGRADQATAARLLDSVLRLRASFISDEQRKPLAPDAAPSAVVDFGGVSIDTNSVEPVCTVELVAGDSAPALSVVRYPAARGWIGLSFTNSPTLYVMPQTNLPSSLLAPLDLAMLHDRAIFRFDPATVKRVAIRSGDGASVSVSRDPLAGWMSEKGSAAPDVEGLKKYLGEVASLSASRVLRLGDTAWLTDGENPRQPWFEVSFDFDAGDALRNVLTVYGPTEDGGRAAVLRGHDALFELSAESVELLKRLLNAAGSTGGAAQDSTTPNPAKEE